ncbi:MAG TPA: hypothetical protein VKY85_04380 [Candidatus Angelobacter sp.]|nr:hypothetical protein [Candidatus Angelobacter sp.]
MSSTKSMSSNSALLATLHDAEFHDAARFEKLRLAGEHRPHPKKKKPAPPEPGRKQKQPATARGCFLLEFASLRIDWDQPLEVGFCLCLCSPCSP